MHCDLKPANVQKKSRYQWKVSDFGLSHYDDQKQEVLKGTVEYMAPEILYSQTYSSYSDWFSMGIILMELIIPSETINPLFPGISTIKAVKNLILFNCYEEIEEYIDSHHLPFIENLKNQKPHDRDIHEIVRKSSQECDFTKTSDILRLLKTPELKWEEEILILALSQLQENPAARLRPELIASFQQEALERWSKRQSIDTPCYRRCIPKCCLIQ